MALQDQILNTMRCVYNEIRFSYLILMQRKMHYGNFDHLVFLMSQTTEFNNQTHLETSPEIESQNSEFH